MGLMHLGRAHLAMALPRHRSNSAKPETSASLINLPTEPFATNGAGEDDKPALLGAGGDLVDKAKPRAFFLRSTKTSILNATRSFDGIYTASSTNLDMHTMSSR